MSTPAAIATVTATLQHLLVQATSGTDITTKPPGTARNGVSGRKTKRNVTVVTLWEVMKGLGD